METSATCKPHLVQDRIGFKMWFASMFLQQEKRVDCVTPMETPGLGE